LKTVAGLQRGFRRGEHGYDDPVQKPIPFLCWLAVRYRSDRISAADRNKIEGTIPNRIAYFDRKSFDMYPIARKSLGQT
jgi:hypothetical protein